MVCSIFKLKSRWWCGLVQVVLNGLEKNRHYEKPKPWGASIASITVTKRRVGKNKSLSDFGSMERHNMFLIFRSIHCYFHDIRFLTSMLQSSEYHTSMI